ncbi:SRPBCC family protein [Thermomonospora umbrina]|uniref:Polyketide cyclase/dehydrase/lipid transport protein n=1 Tax=Thermomonospora umbrina TaxID=111806 RepID=A0A3D9T583_9ACTN|nr:SRPBCC family protein [Thermomonospora umbrina]REE99864.1 polyketide cyclase/dehydrase/lipid transport protein [Thermomonospora umbrina]
MDFPPSSGRITIAAPLTQVYELISDPVAMAAFAEETFKVRWLGRARRPAVGARFRGYNRNRWRLWWTTATIIDLIPGRRFAYDVKTPFGVPISRWQYEVEATDDGCTVTETAWIRVPDWFIPFAIRITGRPDRPTANSTHIARTLRRLKEHVESARP